jgi:hypothetical protein
LSPVIAVVADGDGVGALAAQPVRAAIMTQAAKAVTLTRVRVFIGGLSFGRSRGRSLRDVAERPILPWSRCL